MGRDIRFIRAYCKQLEDESSEEFYEREYIASVDLGSGDAWPCYFRPIMVAAYRRVASCNSYSEEEKKEILDVILACCPPSHEKIDNNNMRCGYYHTPHAPSIFGGRQKMINERALFEEYTQLRLHKAGIWSILELVLMHNRMCLTTPTIRRVSEMMELVRNFIPLNADCLKGTPYGEVDDDYNLADERSIKLADAFKLASTEENVYARIE